MQSLIRASTTPSFSCPKPPPHHTHPPPLLLLPPPPLPPPPPVPNPHHITPTHPLLLPPPPFTDLAVSSGDIPKKGSRYLQYLEEFRRLRRGRAVAAAAANGAAGLPSLGKYGGRPTPRRGARALAPPDGLEADFFRAPCTIRMVAGHSGFVEHDPLITRRPVSAEDLRWRPSVRQFAHAFGSSMLGAGAVVVAEAPARRAVRRRGAEAPEEEIERTKRRVHIDSERKRSEGTSTAQRSAAHCTAALRSCRCSRSDARAAS